MNQIEKIIDIATWNRKEHFEHDDTMQEQKGKGNAFIFGFPVSTGTVYIDRYTEKKKSV